MLDVYNTIVYPVIYIFPAYAANGAPILFGGRGGPLDRERKFKGKRIFGDNKTVFGTISALACGVITGIIYVQFPQLSFMLPIAVMLTLGAVFGDLLGSFIKRQLQLKPGTGFPVMDQYGFFIFALLFAFWLGNLPNIYGLLFIAILTGVLHVFTNRGAHRLKLKSVPW